MSATRVLCNFSKQGSCLKGENTELSHHGGGDQAANNVCAFYQRGACSNDGRFTHDHARVSHSNPVFQHATKSTADPHQALLH